MSTLKDDLHHIVDSLPDDATADDVHYHLYVRETLLRRIREAEQGKTVTLEEARRRLNEWRASSSTKRRVRFTGV